MAVGHHVVVVLVDLIMEEGMAMAMAMLGGAGAGACLVVPFRHWFTCSGVNLEPNCPWSNKLI